MKLIKINVYHRKDEGEIPNPQQVSIIYPKIAGEPEEVITILPREGHLSVNYGLYGRSGFFNNTIHIVGEWGKQRVEKKLPLNACEITDYYNL